MDGRVVGVDRLRGVEIELGLVVVAGGDFGLGARAEAPVSGHVRLEPASVLPGDLGKRGGNRNGAG